MKKLKLRIFSIVCFVLVSFPIALESCNNDEKDKVSNNGNLSVLEIKQAKDQWYKQGNINYIMSIQGLTTDTIVNLDLSLYKNDAADKDTKVDVALDTLKLDSLIQAAADNNDTSSPFYKAKQMQSDGYAFSATQMTLMKGQKIGENFAITIHRNALLQEQTTGDAQGTFILPIQIKNSNSYKINSTLNTVMLIVKLPGIDQTKPDPTTVRQAVDGMQLVWSDEFNTAGAVNSQYWNFEKGFVRNQELQWYQSDNATCDGNGALVITGNKEQVKNPNYVNGSSDWKTNRDYAQYTSSSMTTSGKFSFKYGRILVRAKIPTSAGSWPAIWTLGNWYEWPSCGEIDILESYPSGGVSAIHANTCWGSDTRWSGNWNSVVKPLSYFTAKDPNWASKYHIWRMDWDENVLRIYIDDELVNETNQANTQNGSSGGDGAYQYPFRQAHYILLNLAIGGNAGTPDDSAFPLKYYIDYVRVYQKK